MFPDGFVHVPTSFLGGFFCCLFSEWFEVFLGGPQQPDSWNTLTDFDG